MPEKAVTAAVEKPAVMPIGELISASWEHLKLVWKKLLVVSLISVAVVFVGMFLTVLVIGALGLTTVALGGGAGAAASAVAVGGLSAVIMSIVFIVLFSVFQAAMLQIIAAPEDSRSAMDFLKASVPFAWPMILTNLLIAFLAIGGFFMFVIPGIIISILLSLAMFEVVLQKQSATAALKNSATIVSRNFGTFFVRWLTVVGLYIAYSIVVSILMLIPGLNILISLANNVIGILLGWFFLIYWYLVYKQTRSITKMEQPSSTVWMYVVAVIGWVAMVFMAIALGSLISSLMGSTLMKDSMKNELQMEKSFDYESTDMMQDEQYQLDPNTMMDQAFEEGSQELTPEEQKQLDDLKKMIEAELEKQSNQ